MAIALSINDPMDESVNHTRPECLCMCFLMYEPPAIRNQRNKNTYEGINHTRVFCSFSFVNAETYDALIASCRCPRPC